MTKSLLGIQLKKTPTLGLTMMMAIVAIQLVNKFAYPDKKKVQVSVEEFETVKSGSLQESARHNSAGFTGPLFQAAAADMHTQDEDYSTKRIVAMVIYYFFVLTGLVLGESVLGHFNLLMLVTVGIMVEYLTVAMMTISCTTSPVGMVGGRFCCGEYFGWFMCGVTAAILFNYHFLKSRKVSTFVFGLMFLALGAGTMMYQKYYVGFPGDNKVDEATEWCAAATQSGVPYLLGGMTTMGALGLLFTKVPGA